MVDGVVHAYESIYWNFQLASSEGMVSGTCRCKPNMFIAENPLLRGFYEHRGQQDINTQLND